MNKLTVFIALVFLSLTALAEAKQARPCKVVIDACKQAGFTEKKSKNGKATRADCVLPIVAGKSVEGVSVTPEDVSACGKNIEKRKTKRAELKKEAKAKRTESHQDAQ